MSAVSPSFISAAGRLNIFLRSMRRASKPVLLKDWAKRYSVQHKMFLNRSCHFLHIQIRKSCCPIHAACDVLWYNPLCRLKPLPLKPSYLFERSGGLLLRLQSYSSRSSSQKKRWWGVTEQVTCKPASFARLIYSNDFGSNTCKMQFGVCVTCKLNISRYHQFFRQGRNPGRPELVLIIPSCISPNWPMVLSTGTCITTPLKAFTYCSAFTIRPADCTFGIISVAKGACTAAVHVVHFGELFPFTSFLLRHRADEYLPPALSISEQYILPAFYCVQQGWCLVKQAHCVPSGGGCCCTCFKVSLYSNPGSLKLAKHLLQPGEAKLVPPQCSTSSAPSISPAIFVIIPSAIRISFYCAIMWRRGSAIITCFSKIFMWVK